MPDFKRKLWVGIGVATLIGGTAGEAGAQHGGGKGHGASRTPAAGDNAEAKSTAQQGGEAYLTGEGPRDPRIRFYRDIALMRGHIRVGEELAAEGRWDDALVHFLHPTEEIYKGMRPYIQRHGIRPFDGQLKALAQAVKARNKAAMEQAGKVVDRGLTASLEKVKGFMSPYSSFTMRSAVEVLKVAAQEYEASIENGKFALAVEYQDSRGFVWHVEDMLNSVAADAEKIDKGRFAEIRKLLDELKTVWPAAMPPPAPVKDPEAVTAMVSRIAELSSKYW